MHPTTHPIPSAPHLEKSGRPVYDQTVWIRLPRPSFRCGVSGLSRSTLAELVRPCERNDYRPPVEARMLKRKGSSRGVLLINRASLLDFLSGLPAPAGGDSGQVSTPAPEIDLSGLAADLDADIAREKAANAALDAALDGIDLTGELAEDTP